jgi:hypothetical protein
MPAEVAGVVFNETNAYYAEISCGQVSFEGTVQGWFTMDLNRTCAIFAASAMFVSSLMVVAISRGAGRIAPLPRTGEPSPRRRLARLRCATERRRRARTSREGAAG